ncbi:retrotransposon protein, putative, ty1-copia subclass, partial [Tanacetum coccineum]
LHAMLKLHEQTLPKKYPALHVIQAGKVQKKNKKQKKPQLAARGHNQGKGKNKLTYVPKPKIPPPPKKENPAKDSICHQCGDTGIFTIELYTFPNKSWVYDTGCGTHICNTTQGLRGSRKLKPGALSLYMGNGIILVSSLYDDDFVNRFVDNAISVSRNNMVYFSAVPRDGIFEIDLSNSNTNDSSIKKRIEKLQHDGLLNSIDLKAFEKCVSCMSGKMAHLEPCQDRELATSSLLLMTLVVMNPTRYGSLHDESNNSSKVLLDYTLETAARILNMVPTKKVEKTPYKVWHGQALKLSYLKVWGCEALVKRDTLTKLDKLEPRSINLITQEASKSLQNLDIIQKEDMHPSINTRSHHEEDDIEIDEPQNDIIPIRRSTRTRHAPDRMCLYIIAEEHELGDLGEPANYKAAVLDPESDKWLNAMNVKMQSMKDNEVWDLADLSPNGKIVGSKWLFKKKTGMDGAVHTY